MLRKKAWATFLILATLLLICAGCLSAGSVSPYRGRYTYDISLISEVSFVWSDSDGTISMLEPLEPDQYVSFFQSFSQLDHGIYWNDPETEVTGSAVLITFHNGDYHLINHYCSIRSIDGKADYTLEYYGYDEFTVFWQQYCSQDYILP